MKTNILLTVALVAGMMLAGCSKDESNMEETKGQTLTKEQIVGVWRSGDYWVSFSSDGYMSAYLSDKCIAEGDYTIDGDTVKVTDGIWRNTYWGMGNTHFEVAKISEGSLTATATFTDLSVMYYYSEETEVAHTLRQTYTFSKTSETPCSRNNVLIGKSCKAPMDVWYYTHPVLSEPGYPVCIDGSFELTVESRNQITVRIYPFEYEGETSGDIISYDYVYLQPKIYMIAIDRSGPFEPNSPMKIYDVAFGDDGSISIPYKYPDDIDGYLLSHE